MVTHLLRATLSPLLPSHPITSAMHWIRSINMKNNWSPLLSLNDIDPVWHASRKQTRKEVCWCPWMLCYPVLCPYVWWPKISAQCALNLADVIVFSDLSVSRQGSYSQLHHLLRSIPTPASHLAPAKAQAVAVSVLGGQKPLAAGWTTSMVYLGSIHQNRNISKRHICGELRSLYLKTDCSELYKGPEPRGNTAKLPLSGTQYHTVDRTLVFIDLTFDMLTPKVHYQSNWQYYHSDCLYGIVDKAKQNRGHVDYRIFI